MQHKPKSGDLFDRGAEFNFAVVPLKAHRKLQYITILHGELGLADGGRVGMAIDYSQLTGGGVGYNGEIGKRVKIWKVKGT